MTGFAAPGGWAFGPGAVTDDDLRDLRRRMRAHMGVHHQGGRRGPGRAFGGPFGAFGPMGGRGWGFGPGEGRRAGRGDVRTAVLALLTEGPRHGYQMIGEIAERSGGAWKPSPGSIYPVLSALQDEGLVDDEKIDGKRVFSLTEAGCAYAAERADELGHVFDANTPDEDSDVVDLRQLLMSVGGAAVQVVTTGTPEQVAAARKVLSNARRELYLILAEDES